MKIELRLQMESIEELDRVSAHLRMLGDPHDTIPFETGESIEMTSEFAPPQPIEREEVHAALREFAEREGGAALKELLDRHNASRASEICISDYPLVMNELRRR